MRLISLLAVPILFLLSPFVLPQDVPLELKGNVETIQIDRVVTTVIKENRTLVKTLPCEVSVPVGAIRPTWIVPSNVVAVTKGRVLQITSAPQGEVTIKAEWAHVDFDKKIAEEVVGSLTFNVGNVPTPTPVPPTPTPIPVPPVPDPTPKPTPTPAPIPMAGLRVLVIFDEASQRPLTAKQQNELWGAELDAYVLEKCAKGPDGKTPEFRRFGKGTDMSKAQKYWTDAMNLPRVAKDVGGNPLPDVPWIIISDGVTGYSGPLPEGGQILPLIRKYGG